MFGAPEKKRENIINVEYNSCSILCELSERLGLDQKALSSISERLKLLRARKSSYTLTQIVSTLHYIHQMEDGLYTSTQGYTRIYNGCVDSEVLGKCVKYVVKTLDLKLCEHTSEWTPLIQPYVNLFHLSEKDIQSVEIYCGKIYAHCGASVYDIAAMSTVMFCVDCRGSNLRESLVRVEEKHKATKSSLTKMYFRLRKKYLK